MSRLVLRFAVSLLAAFGLMVLSKSSDYVRAALVGWGAGSIAAGVVGFVWRRLSARKKGVAL